MSAEQARVEETLRRIDDLVGALGHLADPAARESARELVEAVLDMHGLALARIMAILVADDGGRRALRMLAEDDQVKAVLLLYGLHPDDPATRVREALERLRPRLTAAGIEVRLAQVVQGAASVRVFAARPPPETLRREIEEAIVNAAPDLDEIAVEWPDFDPGSDHAEEAPALAG